MKELQQLKERRKRRGIRRKKAKVQLLPKMILDSTQWRKRKRLRTLKICVRSSTMKMSKLMTVKNQRTQRRKRIRTRTRRKEGRIILCSASLVVGVPVLLGNRPQTTLNRSHNSSQMVIILLARLWSTLRTTTCTGLPMQSFAQKSISKKKTTISLGAQLRYIGKSESSRKALSGLG